MHLPVCLCACVCGMAPDVLSWKLPGYVVAAVVVVASVEAVVVVLAETINHEPNVVQLFYSGFEPYLEPRTVGPLAQNTSQIAILSQLVNKGTFFETNNKFLEEHHSKKSIEHPLVVFS